MPGSTAGIFSLPISVCTIHIIYMYICALVLCCCQYLKCNLYGVFLIFNSRIFPTTTTLSLHSKAYTRRTTKRASSSSIHGENKFKPHNNIGNSQLMKLVTAANDQWATTITTVLAFSCNSTKNRICVCECVWNFNFNRNCKEIFTVNAK